MTNCSVAWRAPIALGCRHNVTYTHCRVCTLLWLTHEQLSLTPPLLLPACVYVSTTCLACLAPYELQSVWPIFSMSSCSCVCVCVCKQETSVSGVLFKCTLFVKVYCNKTRQREGREMERTWNRSRNPKMFCMHKFNMNFWVRFGLVWVSRRVLVTGGGRLKFLSKCVYVCVCVWHALSRQLSLFAYFRVPHSMKYASRRCLLHLLPRFLSLPLSPCLSLLPSTYLCIRAHFFCLCRSAADSAAASAAVVVHFNFVCIWQATRCGIQRNFHSFASRSLNMRNSPAYLTSPLMHPSSLNCLHIKHNSSNSSKGFMKCAVCPCVANMRKNN